MKEIPRSGAFTPEGLPRGVLLPCECCGQHWARFRVGERVVCKDCAPAEEARQEKEAWVAKLRALSDILERGK